jgi:hypothetical protein
MIGALVIDTSIEINNKEGLEVIAFSLIAGGLVGYLYKKR